MNVTVAYNFLQISETATPEEANSAYKKLLKEYHPDTNTAQSEWAHRMTIRLREAYSVVLSYMDNLLDQSQAEFASEKVYTETAHSAYSAERNTDSGHNRRHNEPHVQTQNAQYSISTQLKITELHRSLSAHIESYYLHGMHKLYLREEGSLRQHFRITMYRLEQTIIDIEELSEWPGSRKQQIQSKRLHEFARAFYENMLIRPQNQAEYNTKAGKLYSQGTEALDTLIQENIAGNKIRGSKSAEAIAEKNFLHVIRNYSESPFVAATIIKLFVLRASTLLARAFREE